MEKATQSGFNNEFASAAIPCTFPRRRNSPQRAPFRLYAELLSGGAFMATRAENRPSWHYRRQPSVVTIAFAPYEQKFLLNSRQPIAPIPPKPLRWALFPIPEEPADVIDGLRTVVFNGDADDQTGVALHAFGNCIGRIHLAP